MSACEDYARRLPRDVVLEIRALRPEPRGRGRTTAQILAAEAKTIAAATIGFQTVALDEHGEPWTSVRLAHSLGRWRDESIPVAFVIGSADGLSESVKRNANVIMSLSALTLPHALVRVVLIEQIYRATSILSGHPYHRE